jgi:signal transduction histidine kinase
MSGRQHGHLSPEFRNHASGSSLVSPLAPFSIGLIESSPFSRYGVAVLSVAVAVVSLQVTLTYLMAEPYVSMFLCAIIFATWMGGLGPGLLSLALSVLAFEYFIEQSNRSLFELRELPRLLLFMLSSLFVIWVSATQRRTSKSLQNAIVQQKKTEASLLRSEMYLAEAQRLSRTGSFGWKIGSDEITWSDETFRILECDPATRPDINLVLQRIHPEDRESMRQLGERARNGAREFDHELRLLMPDGRVKHVRATAHAVNDGSGYIEFVGAVTDITAAKQAEAALQDARASLAHATRVMTLGELTTSIAHEVNQPLAAALSNAEACVRWLERGTSHLDRARLSVDRVISDVTRAAEVIKKVRALASRTATETTLFDLNDLANESVALLRRELLSNGVAVRMELAPAALTVRADRIQVQQVIINLVMNGVEAMQQVAEQERQLTVRTRAGENEVHLLVEDSGVGIPVDSAVRVFDAFYTTKPRGLGLGLSVCRSIIEAHDGKLSAAPNQGRGATFQFMLPLHRAA